MNQHFPQKYELNQARPMTQPILAIRNLSPGVHKFPARGKRANLPWHAAMAAVEGKGETVSTETEKELS